MARGRFSFWLDFNRNDELLIAELIDELKAARLFSKTIRDGIRLICDLRAGRTEVLFELFPDLWRTLEPPKTVVGDNLDRRLDQIEQLLLQNSMANTPALSAGGNPQQITARLPAPIFDDDDTIELKTVKVDGRQANLNFLNSLMNL